MKLLLDTHVFLWLRSEPQKISQRALSLYRERNNIVYLSIVSVWEMQIKYQIGKLDLDTPLQEIIEEQCEANSLQILPLRLKHIFGLGNLPLYHKDPFDRLLLVQSQTEGIRLISSDRIFSLYQVDLCW